MSHDITMVKLTFSFGLPHLNTPSPKLLAGFTLPSLAPLWPSLSAWRLAVLVATKLNHIDFQETKMAAGLCSLHSKETGSLGVYLCKQGLATPDQEMSQFLTQGERQSLKEIAISPLDQTRPRTVAPTGVELQFINGNEFAICLSHPVTGRLQHAYLKEFKFKPGLIKLVLIQTELDVLNDQIILKVQIGNQQGMVEAGLYEINHFQSCPSAYMRAELTAKQAKRGIWANRHAQPISLLNRNSTCGRVVQILNSGEMIFSSDKGIWQIQLGKLQHLNSMQIGYLNAFFLLCKQCKGHRFKFILEKDFDFKKKGSLIRIQDYADISKLLLTKGLARVDYKYAKLNSTDSRQMLSLQQAAIDNKQGIFNPKFQGFKIKNMSDLTAQQFKQRINQLPMYQERQAFLYRYKETGVFEVILLKEEKMVQIRLAGLKYLPSLQQTPQTHQLSLSLKDLVHTQYLQLECTVSFMQIIDLNNKLITGQLRFKAKKQISEEILSRGLAYLDSNQFSSHSLFSAQEQGRMKQSGVWSPRLRYLLINNGYEPRFEDFQEIKIQITHIENEKAIFFQDLSQQEVLTRIQNGLDDSQAVAEIRVGCVYCVRYWEDQCLYRAVVLKKYPTQLRVRYIDFGNQQTVTIKDVYKLNEELVRQPEQAIQLQLSFLSFTDNYPLLDTFKQILLQQTVQRLFIRSQIKGHRLIVKGQLFSAGKTKSLNLELVEQGLAIFNAYQEGPDKHELEEYLQAQRLSMLSHNNIWQDLEQGQDELMSRLDTTDIYFM